MLRGATCFDLSKQKYSCGATARAPADFLAEKYGVPLGTILFLLVLNLLHCIPGWSVLEELLELVASKQSCLCTDLLHDRHRVNRSP